MKLAGLCFLLFILTASKGFTQANFVVSGITPQTFLPGTEWIKVFVCKEDETVWALSAGGNVYFKRRADGNFTEFAPTAGIQIADLAGFSYNQMYFVTAPATLYYCRNQGVLQPVTLTGASVINNIAVVNGEKNTYVSGYLGSRDWLVIAANNSMFSIYKEDENLPNPYGPVSSVVGGWRITNSGFKSVDFQYATSASATCFGNVNKAFYSIAGTDDPRKYLPEGGSFGSAINTTYFEAPFNKVLDGTMTLDYWGTDQGLFVKRSNACDLSAVKKKLNFKVNDLEELNFARGMFNFKYMLVATDNGLYYNSDNYETNSANFDLKLENMQFNRYNSNLGKVNSIAQEIKSNETVATEAGYNLCDDVIWLATVNGIVKLTMGEIILNTDYAGRGSTSKIITMSPDRGVGYGNLCNGNSYTLTVNLPNIPRDQYTIRWFMDEERYSDRRERPDFFDQSSLTLNTRGVYGVEITYGCRDLIVTGSVWLRQVPDPVFSFNTAYADEVYLCQGGTLELGTDENWDRGQDPYVYRWIKDGNVISGETNNKYQVTSTGKYSVEIRNCVGDYISSKIVTVKELSLDVPVVTRSSTKSLCFGEKVTLSAPELTGVTYKWSNGSTSRVIEVGTAGNYHVDVIYNASCIRRSATVNVVVNPELKLMVPPEVQICTIRDQKLTLTAPPGFTAYNWDGVPGTVPNLEVVAPGVHTLEVVDASGCKASSSYVVVAYCPALVPPNAFSPNGDGVNDVWKLEGLEDHPDTVVKIYNRFGGLVYERKGSKQVWDGRLDGTDVPVGIYYYVVSNSRNKAMTGSLVLIR